MSHLRAVIIDEDRERREQIRTLLPDYIDGVTVGYGDGAFEQIRPDAQGNVPDIVILYGDDSRSQGLYIYDWMINKSGNADISLIPVVVITEDEFSDRSVEFLEIGDVSFYEGRIDESRLFSVITEAIEAAEFLPEPPVSIYEETKSIDRLAGASVKAPGDDKDMRAVVLDEQTRQSNLEAALARGRKRASDIRKLIDAAQNVKEDIISYKRREYRRYEPVKKDTVTPVSEVSAGPEDRPEPKQVSINSGSIEKLRQKAMSNPFGAFNAQGSIKLDEPTRRDNSKSFEKKTVVITDSDLKTRKLCALYLTQNYNVISLDSGIRTVDFFVKNRADLLIINPILPGMDGISTVNSVHMQPGCINIPIMYLVGDDYMEPRSRLMGPNVFGILNKPVKREMIAQAVEGLFGSNE